MFNFRKKRIASLTSKAESGDVEAQCELGRNFIKGIDVELDNERGWYWLSLSAESGFAKAQASLAALILRDCISDEAKLFQAFSLAEKATQQGNGLGTAILARFYVDGLVVDEDMDKALELYKLAYERGLKKARISVNDIERYKLMKKLGLK